LKKKVVYIISNINKALAFEWVATSLNKEKIELQFILLNPVGSDLESFLINLNIPVKRISYTGKWDIPRAVLQTFFYLKKQKPNSVHAHLFDASIVGMLAAWLSKVPKRIYTRHHADYHHIFFPKAVKYDNLINWLSTDIIAISLIVKDILTQKEHVPLSKIHLIHHGFDLEKFSNVSPESIKRLQEKYNANNTHPVIGVISRYIEFKGVHYIIPAYAEFIKKYPDALLILANASGSYSKEIKKLLADIPQKNYIEILFEPEIFSLYKLFDIFIHASVYRELESFGQTYVEALISKVPSIFTLSGVANEFIEDGYNALVVPFKNSEAIYKAMVKLYEDENLKTMFRENGEKSVISRFQLSKMILALEELYVK
jgi:glycosyltransferase involved in cell wall biosynthesis